MSYLESELSTITTSASNVDLQPNCRYILTTNAYPTIRSTIGGKPGDVIEIVGTVANWVLEATWPSRAYQAGDDTISLNGAVGYWMRADDAYSSLKLLCISSNEWVIVHKMGNFTVGMYA